MIFAPSRRSRLRSWRALCKNDGASSTRHGGRNPGIICPASEGGRKGGRKGRRERGRDSEIHQLDIIELRNIPFYEVGGVVVT